MAQRLNMGPGNPMNDHVNQSFADSEHLGQLRLGNYTRAIHGSNCNHVFIGKFMPAMALSLEEGLASAIYHVRHILSVGSSIKMSRIAARSIVACVADFISDWHRTIGNDPCISVGHNRRTTLWSGPNILGLNFEQPISFRSLIANPRPAFLRSTLNYFSPESYLGCGFGDHDNMEPHSTGGVKWL